MKTVATSCEESPPLVRSRIADYLELTKPRLTVLVLFTVAASFLLASNWNVDLAVLLHTLFGTALVAAGASALNHYLERDCDALMKRTESRPLPGGRLQPIEALLFGVILGSAGIAYLAAGARAAWAAVVAASAFASYAFVYTPLKRKTALNTVVGAVSGALPPVIGWVAVRCSIGLEALSLFLIVFLWQLPHFLAIAWIYREDYERGGFRMLPIVDRTGQLTWCCMVICCLALIPVSLVSAIVGDARASCVGVHDSAGQRLPGVRDRLCTTTFRGAARRAYLAGIVDLSAFVVLVAVAAKAMTKAKEDP